MRPAESFRMAWFLGAILAWSVPVGSAESPAPTSPPSAVAADSDTALARALDLERQRNWTAAITLYEDAIDQWPERTELRHRLRLCEIHYRLGRRYQDQSFRNVLLRLSREKALTLYDELLERIETQYVEPVAMEPLIRRGLDNLEVALRDPVFLKANAAGADPDRVQKLRETFRNQRGRISARNRLEARRQVSDACDQARQAVGIGPAAVILEFVFGACDALDDYSSYLTPDKLEDLYAMIDGNFVGLGVELKSDEKGLRLVGVIAGGPAAEAGLRAEDRITHVGGKSVAGMSLDEAAGRLQGAEGTAIEITVLSPDGTSRRLNLTRRPVEVRSVAQAKIVDTANGVGYLQLIGFQKTSAEELGQAVATLQRQGMRYLVLDLRGNPGGLLNVAVEIADKFLDQGVIVSTRGRAPGQSFIYRAQPDASWRMPMAILIDHDSASASEILAGALKDHKRALILGEQSYGKGSVQSIFALNSAPAGLKLTTAKFYSPRNRPYSEQGVEPDLRVHTVAKPAGDGDSALSADFGNPDHDPVLERAIQQARRALTSAR